MLIGNIYVHAVDAGYQHRESQYDGDGRESFHHYVEVIGNDTGESIHGTAEDVGICVCHFQCLGSVYDQVVEEFLFIFVEAEEIRAFQFHEQQFVATEGGHEVNEAFLNTHEGQQLFVSVGIVEFLFQHIPALIDFLEMIEEVDNHFFKYFEHHHISLFRGAVMEGVEEFFDSGVVEGIYRDDLVMCENDHDGDGDVVGITIIEGIIFCRCFNNDQPDLVFELIAGAFIDIEGIGEEVEGDVQVF